MIGRKILVGVVLLALIFSSVSTVSHSNVFANSANDGKSLMTKKAANERDLDDGLVAYYNFDEGSGNILHDLSGHKNNGNIYGAKWTDGIEGKALSFDGEDDYVNCGYSLTNSVLDAITISAWINIRSFPKNKNHFDIFYDGSDGEFCLTVMNNHTVGMHVKIDGTWYGVFSENTLNLNVWYYIAGIYSRKVGKIEIFLNGEFNGKVNVPEDPLWNPYGDYYPTIASYSDAYDGRAFLFEGIIDNLRIYNRSLSTSEIRELYGSVPHPLTPPQNLQAIPGDNLVELAWTPSADDASSSITGYRIYRGTTAGGESYLTDVNCSVTTYTDYDVMNGQTYYYYITAVNGSEESSPSEEVSATPSPNVFIIKSQHAGYFLTNLTFENTFGAYILWNGSTPVKVWAKIGLRNYSVSNHTGIWWNLTVNMGEVGFVNNITFYAQFSNGSIISKSKNVEMLHTPLWLSKMISICFWAYKLSSSKNWEQHWALVIDYPPEDFSKEFNLSSAANLPFIGGMYGSDIPYSFKLKYESTGEVEIEGELKTPDVDLDVGVGDASVNLGLSASGKFSIENSTIIWDSAELDLKVEGKFEATYPLLGYSFHFGGHDITIGVAARFEVNPEFAIGLLFMPTDNLSRELVPGTGIMLKGLNGTIKIPFTLAIDAGVAIGRVTGGGTLELDMGALLNQTFEPHAGWLKIIGKVFIKLEALWFQTTLWEDEGTIYSWNGTRDIALRGDGWNLTVRYYNTTGYNTLVWDSGSKTGDVINDIYPRTHISMTNSGKTDVLFYTYDDVNLPEAHGFNIKGYRYDYENNAWDEISPPPISNEIAFKPVAKTLSNGKILVLWNTIPYSETITSPEDITSTNLTMGIYDPATNSWEDVKTILSNAVAVDYSILDSSHALILKADNILGIQSSAIIVDLNDGNVLDSLDVGNSSNIVSVDTNSKMAVIKSIEGNYSLLVWTDNDMQSMSISKISNFTINSIELMSGEVYVLYTSLNGTSNKLVTYVLSGSTLIQQENFILPVDAENIRLFSVNGITLTVYNNVTSLIIGKLDNGTFTLLKTISANNITNYGVLIHNYTVRIWYLHVTGGNLSAPIKSLGFAVIETTPGSPANVTAIGGNGYVYLNWSEPSVSGLYPLSEYKIYRDGVLIATVPATQLHYNDTDVTPGTTYTYAISAVNKLGDSEHSREIQATPGGNVPELSPDAMLFGLFVLSLLLVLRRKKRVS